jgi:hypothetical protein
VIPDAAVEAAVKVILGYIDESFIMEDEEGNARKAALEILSVVSPILMATAWEEGKEAGMLDYYNTPNPYRSVK